MKDPQTALRVVCQQLSFIAEWTPPLVDDNGEPTDSAPDTEILETCERIEAQDEKKTPPNGPRLDRFVRRVDEQISWEFFLLPGELTDGSLPTVAKVVQQIMLS